MGMDMDMTRRSTMGNGDEQDQSEFFGPDRPVSVSDGELQKYFKEDCQVMTKKLK